METTPYWSLFLELPSHNIQPFSIRDMGMKKVKERHNCFNLPTQEFPVLLYGFLFFLYNHLSPPNPPPPKKKKKSHPRLITLQSVRHLWREYFPSLLRYINYLFWATFLGVSLFFLTLDYGDCVSFDVLNVNIWNAYLLLEYIFGAY